MKNWIEEQHRSYKWLEFRLRVFFLIERIRNIFDDKEYKYWNKKYKHMRINRKRNNKFIKR